MAPLAADAPFVLGAILLSKLLFIGAALATTVVIAGKTSPTLTAADVAEPVGSMLTRVFLSGDGGWYLRILQNGYEPGPFSPVGTHNWAFWPLLPMLAALTGGSVFGGVLVTTAAFVLALLLIAHEVRSLYGGEAARWAVLFLAFWPYAYVFTSFRPESLHLLGWVLAWAFARRSRWLPAWLAVGFASLARPTGILGAILVIGALVQSRPAPKQAAAGVAGVLIPVLVVAGFSAYLGAAVGDPLAWLHAQAAWHSRDNTILKLAVDVLAHPFDLIRSTYDILFLNLPAFVLGLLVALRLAVRRRLGESVFVAAITLAGPFAGSLIAMVRFVGAAFPIHVLLAEDPRLARFRLVILLVMVTLYVLVAAWLGMGSQAVVA